MIPFPPFSRPCRPAPKRHACCILPIAIFGLLSALPLAAETQVQTAPFSFSTAGDVTGTGSFMQFNAGTTSTFIGTFNPFDGSLGTLDSVQLAWTLTVSGTFTGSTRYQLSTSGSLYLAEVGYSGMGSGNGNTTGSVGYTLTRSSIFPDSTSESNYATMLESLLGESDFTARFASPLQLDFDAFTGTQSYTGDVVGSVTLTYNYSAVPEPATSALLAGLGALGLGLAARRFRHRTA